MQEYSVVVSIYGWSARNKANNVTLSGQFVDLPRDISDELNKMIAPSTNSLCIACTAVIPEASPFHIWFMRKVLAQSAINV